MFLAARAALLSMRASEEFGCAENCLLLYNKICLPYACCGLHFTDSAACVLSFYLSTPLHMISNSMTRSWRAHFTYLNTVLLTWKSVEPVLSTGTWLLKEPKLPSVPLFSQSLTIVILFYLAAHVTFSVDYRKFRNLQWNWFSRHGHVIMCNLFFKLFIGYRSKPDRLQTVTYLPQLLLWLISCLSPARLSDIVTVYTPSAHTRIPRIPHVKAKAVEFSLFWLPSNSVLQNC